MYVCENGGRFSTLHFFLFQSMSYGFHKPHSCTCMCIPLSVFVNIFSQLYVVYSSEKHILNIEFNTFDTVSFAAVDSIQHEVFQKAYALSSYSVI